MTAIGLLGAVACGESGTVDTAASSTTATALVSSTLPASAPAAVVERVVDGDTAVLADGRTVRLAQIDAPETGACFATEATERLRALAQGKPVQLRRPGPPFTDPYDRTLAEISLVGGGSVNESLVRKGFATFEDEYRAEDPDLATRLEAAQNAAITAGAGRWRACAAPSTTRPTVDAPSRFAAPPPTTGPSTTTAAPTTTITRPPTTTTTVSSGGSCYRSYTPCVPPPPPDLNCGDVATQIRVSPIGDDPHGFDSDDDGLGCESNPPA